MNLALFEDDAWHDLLPLTWLRTAAELRCGPNLLVDKIRQAFGLLHAIHIRPELHEVVSRRLTLAQPAAGDSWLLLHSALLVTGTSAALQPGQVWEIDGRVVAAHLSAEEYAGLGLAPFDQATWAQFERVAVPKTVHLIRHHWDLVHANPSELRRVCRHGGNIAGQVDPGVHILAPENVFIGDGARVKPGVVIDAENGPVHIAEGALIEPLAALIGPCYVGPKSIVRPGAKIREETTIGPVCRVGGEVEGSIFLGYANKQHDGFLGHSIVGEWVNLGANTVNSDLKNTYGTIRCSLNGVLTETGERFVGTAFGDHTKTGIGTILPTGCILGVAANVFTQDAIPKFVPSFAWLTADGMQRYQLDKAIRIAQTVMSRRQQDLCSATEHLLGWVCEEARKVEAAGWESK